MKELAEAMKPIIEYADKKGVTICLEAINRYETALLNSAGATVEFIDNGLGNPDCVGILWDLFHANIEDIGYERSIKIMGNKLKHIHLADSNRMFPGYGHTDIAAILKMVKNTGYSEYASFECFNLPSLETVLNETGAWVQKMREL
ncbi:MAG: sugar phosphate isomerase/epimerase family protein [Pilosibacter sp.]